MDILNETLQNGLNYFFNLFESIDWQKHVSKVQHTYENHSTLINENVRKWPLMKSIDETLWISIGYLILIPILSLIMKFFNDLKLKFFVFCYNLFMIGLNLYICGKILFIKYEAKDFGLCSTIHQGNKESLLEMNKVIWWFYIAKGFELLNTLFFLLRKKFHKINFLHVYNHSSMFAAWWMCTAYFNNGAIANGALLSSLLHIVMHFYYVVSSMGQSFQKFIWWKKYIIQFQMLQFCLLILYCSFLLKNECEQPISEKMIWPIIYYFLGHVVLIYNFYTKSYYRIMNANLENSKKLKNDTNASLNDSQNDFRINATRRRPLH